MELVKHTVVLYSIQIFLQVSMSTGQVLFHPPPGFTRVQRTTTVQATSASDPLTEPSGETTSITTTTTIDGHFTDTTGMSAIPLTTANNINISDLDHPNSIILLENDTLTGFNGSTLYVHLNATAVAYTINTSQANSGEALISKASEVTTARTQLNACLLMESGASLWYDYDKSASAVDLAIAYANEQILSPIGFTLLTTYYDIGATCQTRNHAVTFGMDLIDKGISCDVYIGAGCAYNYQSLYDLADYLNIPFIGVPAAGVGADADISLYSNLARLSVTNLNTADVVVRFLKKQNYTTPTIFQDLDIIFNEQLSLIMESFFHNKNLDLYSTSNFQPINSIALTNDAITGLLQDGITGSRVFILITNASTTRQFMLAARDMGLINGDYVFMAVELFTSTSWGIFTWKNNDNFDQAAKEAYQALMLIALSPDVDVAFEAFENKVKEASAVRKTHSYNYGPEEHVDLMTSHFYESIIFYASIMRDLFLNGTDIFEIESFITRINSNYSFDSPIHGSVSVDQNGDRVSSYVIKNFDITTGVFEESFSVPPLSTDVIPLGEINWFGRSQLPPNSPRCGFDGKDPICAPKPLSASIVAAAVFIPTLILSTGLVVGYIYFRRLVKKNSDPFWWRVFIHELTAVALSNPSKVSFTRSRAGSNFQSKKSIGDDDQVSKAATEIDTSKLGFIMFGKNAYFRENVVALRELPLPLQRVSNSLSSDLAAMKSVHHNNLQDFFGIAINDENLCEYVIGEVCQKGSLMTLLEKKSLTLDWGFKYSIMKGITAGMAYLHTTKVLSHGDLSAHTVLIDSRFVVKITDFGMTFFRPVSDLVPPDEDDEDRDFARLLWRAPELLRRPILGGSQKGDVFSFGIIMQQLILRSAPYESSIESQRSDYLTHARDLVMEVKKGAHPPQRPRVPMSACPIVQLPEIMETCWEEHPDMRFTFAKVRELLLKALGHKGDNIIEHLINQMDQYAAELEHEAEEKMKMFMAEKERSEELLKGMLPKSISDKLRRGEMIYPEVFPSATVQFSDINGFPEVLAAAPSAYVTIDIMNSLYSVCDSVIERFNVYKIETVVDCYLLVSGVPIRNGIQHAGEMATLALALRKDVGQLTFPSSPDAKLRLRVGINSGSCVASVVGLKMPKYCLFGDTVNTASRMESHGEAGKIQVSPTTKELLDKIGDFFLSSRGEITVKGKGLMETFWLIAKTSMQ